VVRVNSLAHHHRSNGQAFAPADENGQVRVTGHHLAHDNFLTTNQSSSRGRTLQISECRQGGVQGGGVVTLVRGRGEGRGREMVLGAEVGAGVGQVNQYLYAY
jgi:hypothetical protein